MGAVDEPTGTANEAAGALTGNRSLKNEGKVDDARGKDVVGTVADEVSGR